ncbi:MAG: hypothetical protein ACI9FG_001751 [Crocinitomicaceae bacterium]|jgi:hypothetical protein
MSIPPKIASKEQHSKVFRMFWILTCSLCIPLLAFPPASNYTLYGIVRDQVGQTLTAEAAELILLKGGVEIGRTPINSDLKIDQNYGSPQLPYGSQKI